MNKPRENEFILHRQDEVGDPTLFQRLLEQETVPIPAHLASSNPGFSDEDLSVERYTSRDFHRLEAEKLWPKVWQFVGREERMPQPGELRRKVGERLHLYQ